MGTGSVVAIVIVLLLLLAGLIVIAVLISLFFYRRRLEESTPITHYHGKGVYIRTHSWRNSPTNLISMHLVQITSCMQNIARKRLAMQI